MAPLLSVEPSFTRSNSQCGYVWDSMLARASSRNFSSFRKMTITETSGKERLMVGSEVRNPMRVRLSYSVHNPLMSGTPFTCDENGLNCGQCHADFRRHDGSKRGRYPVRQCAVPPGARTGS